ncbi:ankyrin repeat domain-containing protein [Candidatus Peregrinibacteria bacterium]|nr:ankyrin repeat domain-containing protein [Candidatus Peregrinibacteria bacterium]
MAKRPDKKWHRDELEEAQGIEDGAEDGFIAQGSVRRSVGRILRSESEFPASNKSKNGAFDEGKKSPVESLAANRLSTPLELAIQVADDKKIQKLIKSGADVNEIGRDGRTPLMVAISIGQIDLVKLLIKEGADPNILSDDGGSALSIAIQDHRIKIIRYLLAHGAQVNLANHSDETPLMEALYCEKPSEKVIGILLEAGASVMRKSITGDSPLGLVEKSRNPRLIRFFSERTGYKFWSDEAFEKQIRDQLKSTMRTRFPN